MEHTFRAIDEDLDAIAARLVELGELAVAQVRGAVAALERGDTRLASATAVGDNRLDALDAEIERAAIRFIALRQPMADDLRRAVVAMKSASQLERCGDLAKNVCKRVVSMDGRPNGTQPRGVVDLGGLVAGRLEAVVSAYRARDIEAAHRVWASDREIDEKHEAMMRDIVLRMRADPESIGVCTHLLFIAKNLERIGDHATNVAELVQYQTTGQALAHRPKL